MAVFEELPEDEQEELMARYRAASPEDRARWSPSSWRRPIRIVPTPTRRGPLRRAGSAPSDGLGPRRHHRRCDSEWAYHQFGTVALASSLWPGPILPDPAEGAEKPPDDGEARWLYWNDEVMDGLAFVPFHEVEHPTLGTVELGGWLPGVRVNPPIEEVEAITDDQVRFLADLAGRLARSRSSTRRPRPRAVVSSRSRPASRTPGTSRPPWPRGSPPARPSRSSSG